MLRHRPRPKLRSPLLRARWLHPGSLWVLAGLLIPGGALAAPDPPAAGDDGPAYAVQRFEVRYASPADDLPDLAELLQDRFSLGRRESGFVAPRAGVPLVAVRLPGAESGLSGRFHSSAIGALSAQLVARLHARGLLGVYVAPDPGDIDLDSERDLRHPDDEILRLVISIARIRQVRSVGFGDRLPPDWRTDHSAHRAIRSKSPLQSRENLRDGGTDLVRRDLLDDYLFRLNRHPGRRVDAALAPAEEPGGVTLDFRVTEARPWFVYAQASDTGTQETNPWQQRYGFVHRQLTDRDDILSFDYLNAGFDDVNAANLSYETPWFGSQRPKWMRDGLGSWLPWLGSDRLRLQLFGAWSRVVSSGIDHTDDILSKEWSAGARFVYAAWQHGPLFLDLFAGAKIRNIESVNRTLQTRPQEYIFLPEVGFALERVTGVSSLLADVGIEGSVTELGREEAQLLGRIDPDRRWLLLRVDSAWSTFLEPILFRSAWEDPSTPGSSKLAHEVSLSLRGQYAFGARLVPQVSQVVGGLFSVRGYPQSAAVGDDVAVASAEYRFHLARSLPIRRRPMKLPFLGDFRAAPAEVYGSADWDLVLRAFADAGTARRNGPPVGSLERDQTLLGVGAGAELLLRGNLRASFDWGRALRASRGSVDPVPKGHDEFHFLFSLVY